MSSTATIALLGARGMLARELARAFAAEGRVVGLDQLDVDITDEAALHRCFGELRPDLVLHAAAYTNVDGAETERDLAFAVNGRGSGNVARAAAACGAFLIAYSTDFVFDGALGRPYREEDRTNPLGVYGASKLAGEEEILASGARAALLRTAWLYGAGGRNFPDTMIRLARGGADRLRVVCDQVGSPTWTRDLARLSRVVWRDRLEGLFHASNEGEVSWFELAREVFRCLEIRVSVEPITAAELGRPARRPAYAPLDTGRFTTAAGLRPRHWRQALADYLTER